METDVTAGHELFRNLLECVKKVQVRYAGSTELATEQDSKVKCMCTAWENILHHGLRHKSLALSTIKQVTEMTGLSKVKLLGDLSNTETEPSIWNLVNSILIEENRAVFLRLKNVQSDEGRVKAWLRFSLNEHSLERHLHILLSDPVDLLCFYEPWALLCNVEQASMLPVMAAGLDSILFAFNIDDPKLNEVRPAAGLDALFGNCTVCPPIVLEDPVPVLAAQVAVSNSSGVIISKKKKKRTVQLINPEEGDISSSSSVTSPVNIYAFKYPSIRAARLQIQPELVMENLAEPAMKAADPLNKSPPVLLSGEPNVDDLTEICTGSFKHVTISSQEDVNSFEPLPTDEKCGKDQHNDQENILKEADSYLASKDEDVNIRSQDTWNRGSSECLTPNSWSGSPTAPDTFSENSVDTSEVFSGSLCSLSENQAEQFNMRTQGDGSQNPQPIQPTHDIQLKGDSSQEHFRRTFASVIDRKNSLELENRNILSMLEEEKRKVKSLHAEVQLLKLKHHEELESVMRDNSLLKFQLKKQFGKTYQLEIPSPSNEKAMATSLDEADQFSKVEHKLAQMSEMHGELMEFNQVLRSELLAKDKLLEQLQSDKKPSLAQLVSDSPLAIHIWIPDFELVSSGGHPYHLYQVCVRIRRGEEWFVKRRYSQFYDFSIWLKKRYKEANALTFPSKKLFGYKDESYVEMRRHWLQLYLQSVAKIILMYHKTPAILQKIKFCAIFPFFK